MQANVWSYQLFEASKSEQSCLIMNYLEEGYMESMTMR
jgi:hypothetical protein